MPNVIERFRKAVARPPRAARPLVVRSPLVPIIVCSTGRSGTTLMMQLLGTSDRVVFERTYPFEHRYLVYVARLARMLDMPAVDSWTADQIVKGSEMMGPPPWRQRELLAAGSDRGSFGQACFQALWLEFSRQAIANSLPATADDRPSGSWYYAEKVPRNIAEDLLGSIPGKRIHLVRDPRDVYLSLMAFDEKRGFFGFGRKKGEGEQEFLDRYIERVKGNLTTLGRISDTDDQKFMRYEELAGDLAGESRRIEEWLGVRLDPQRVLDDQKQYRHHMTSDSPEESIGRWKREMPEDVKSAFRKRMGDQLTALGYEC